MARVLLIEDDAETAGVVLDDLRGRGHAVTWAATGPDGARAARDGAWGAIILDRMLPGQDGLAVLQDLRRDGDRTPALVLSALGDVDERIRGLRAGGDDYLAKPFSFDILSARIRALLRRPQDVVDNVFTASDLEMDVANHSVSRAGKEVKLSNKEFAILEYLLRNKNRILSKTNIMTHVWDFDADILPNNVEVFINYLRGKVDKPFAGEPLICAACKRRG